MQSIESNAIKPSFSFENYVSVDDNDEMQLLYSLAKILKIKLLSIDGLTIKERNEVISSDNKANLEFSSLNNLYGNNVDEIHTVHDLQAYVFNYLTKNEPNSLLLVSRITIKENSIEKLKNKLSELRNQYEVISVKSDDIKILKWAAKDRRVDYLSIDLSQDAKHIDKALCSLVKQHEKCFEIVLSPLFKEEKELSFVLRNGKKLLKLIKTYNVDFIFSMNPKSAYHLRTGIQKRYLGELLNVPYNSSKFAVFQNQLLITSRNTMKLHENYITNGIKEAK